ncbi:MAG: ATP-binding protein [Candidatus Altiarchaeota archaeon]|nr:ATP-binding protein [Candidatus Altiarchaeota archaeon]
MELRKLAEANPWWQTKKVPQNLRGRDRPKYRLLLKSITQKEVTIITGVRRSGKSTLMYQTIDNLLKEKTPPKQILFVNLEDPRLTNDTLDDIYEAYRSGINPDQKAHIFLDEIHRRENWEKWVKRHYDLGTDCKFTISGSCSYLLKKEYSTLLTGRNLTFEVFPLSFQEYLTFKGINLDAEALEKDILLEKQRHEIQKAMNEYMEEGGFPDAFFKEEDFKRLLLTQYFDDIIYKDIVDRHELNSRKTRDLALYLASNITSPLSLRNIRNTLGLSYESIKDYITYYAEAFLFFTVEHFSYSLKEQKTRPSKAYCIDNGLRNAVSFKFTKDDGKLAENLAYLHLRQNKDDIYYWKDKNEVDFITKNPDHTLTAINVTYTDEVDEREIKSLKEFKQKHKKTQELIIITKNTQKTQEEIKYIPLWKWLLE